MRTVPNAARVREAIENGIVEGRFAPGSKLDPDALAAEFDCSRTPIREALVRLAGEGLVEALPNRTTIVANIDFLNLHHFFDAITLMYRVTTRLAAENHRPEDMETSRAHQVRYAAAVRAQDPLAMIAINRDFHAAIAEAGRNPYYTGLFCRILDEGRRVLRIYYSSFDDHLPRRYVDEHEDIIAAIEARDVEAADRLASQHADQIVRQIQRLIADDRRRPISL